MTALRGANGERRQAVLDYLIREADMDGLVTVTEREIGKAVGVVPSAVSVHILNLAAEGLLKIVGRAEAYRPGCPSNAIQLAESVFA